MFIHILVGLKKSDRLSLDKNEYIRILGFNNIGKNYINKIKKDTNIPIVSNLKNINSKILDYNIKAYKIYNLLSEENILEFEKRNKPIIF